MEGMRQGAGEYEEPTTGGGQGAGQSQADEDAAQEFLPPAEGEAPTETASMAEAGDVAGAGRNLLEAKHAVEERLRQKVAQAVGAQSLDALQGEGNIQGVAIGTSDGSAGSIGDPGSTTLVIYVAEPMSADEVKSVLVDSMGIQAAASDDIPLSVLVTGGIDAQPHRFRLRPAPGGVSVGHFRITAGTIGCLSIGRTPVGTPPRTRRLMVLSNNHVLANSNNAVFGDCIAQPGPFDGGRCPRDQIAILERFVPINFSGGVNFVDCATGWAWPDRVRRELVYLRGGAPVFFRISSAPVAPVLGMTVGKSGRTTQLTVGRVTGIGATIRVNYGGGRVALFADQIAIQGLSGAFSAGGDSGSSIWTWNATRNPVGLLFAGGGGITFANRMTRVLAALDIVLVT
jgi:hypothetical protein